MITGYDAYKDAAPGAAGLAADRQTKKWVVPVHPGAVKALKEAGQWSDEQEAHNNELLKRQDSAGGGMGRLRQGQPAFGRQGIPRGLDEGPRRGAAEGQHAERVSNSLARLLASLQRRRDSAPAHLRDNACQPQLPPLPQGRAANGSSSTIRMRSLANLQEAEVTRVRTLRRRLALGADRRHRGDDPALHQPAILAAVLHRLHPAQHRIFLSADRADAAVHVPDLSGNGDARRSIAFPGTTSCCSSLTFGSAIVPDAQRAQGRRSRLGIRRRADAASSSPASSCGWC